MKVQKGRITIMMMMTMVRWKKLTIMMSPVMKEDENEGKGV